MQRIGLAVVLALGLVFTSGAADAQQAGKVYQVAVLGLQPRQHGLLAVHVLRDGLHDLGYVEGRNLILDHLSADAKPERLPELAAEAVRLRYDVIVTGRNEVTATAKRATSTIPIVMVLGGDPV